MWSWVALGFLIAGIAVLVTMALYGSGIIGTKESKSINNAKAMEAVRQETEASTEEVGGLTHISKMMRAHMAEVESTIDTFAKDADARVSRISEGAAADKSAVIPNVVYINMAKNPERNELTKAEIQRFTQGTSDVYRFEGIPVPENGAKGCFLSHLHVLAWAAKHLAGQHVLVLEDDFVLDVSPQELVEYTKEADTLCNARWDVMVLGQYVHEWQPLSARVFRTFHSTTTSGYLVHANYIQDLFVKWHQAFVPIQKKTSFAPEDNLDQIQVAFQKTDVWLAFDKSLGSQRPGVSTIGHGAANNKWTCSPDRKTWYEHTGKAHPLTLREPATIKSVAVCMVATGKYKQFLASVAASCSARFVKPHKLEFFIFSDAAPDLPDQYSGCPAHKYYVERKGFPGDTLYRYHYILKAEEELKRVDHIFYMDVDYWVCNPAETEKILVEGLVAVKHLHNLHEIGNPRIKGTPEMNPKSQACIPADKSMQFYFCGGFQGGSSARFLEACHGIKAAIDTDDKNGVMAKWHDESHWNRYLVDHPPEVILSQSYVYDENCLAAGADSASAVQLRKRKIIPRMVALSKSHREVRSE